MRGVGGPTTHPPTPPSHLLFLGETTKCNKSLNDPVRGAGSTQMQTRSYCARSSGNLARKVRNAFPGSTALNKRFSTRQHATCNVSSHHPCFNYKSLGLHKSINCLPPFNLESGRYGAGTRVDYWSGVVFYNNNNMYM